MQEKRKIALLCAAVLVCCILMALVDGVWQPHYFVKSAIKLVLFLLVPVLYARTDKTLRLGEMFRIEKKGLAFALALGVAVYAVILGGYFLLRGVFDFSNITNSLTAGIGVHKENFVYVALYISFVNSLLEEFFFRGFAFLGLKKIAGLRFAYLLSAGAFAVYHVAMMLGWFSPMAFVLVMAGLFAGGLIFNAINAKWGSVYPSWLMHMFANFAINTVGFILFGIL